MKLPFFPTHPAANRREASSAVVQKKHAEREKREEISALGPVHERYSLIVPLNAREVSVPKSLSFLRKCSRKITRLDIFYT